MPDPVISIYVGMPAPLKSSWAPGSGGVVSKPYTTVRVEVAEFHERQVEVPDFLNERYEWAAESEIAKIENEHTYQGAMKYVYKVCFIFYLFFTRFLIFHIDRECSVISL